MTNPSIQGLYFVYGYWGITTILFFWAALIKATQSVAGNSQGVFFGALEAGRGLVASLAASLAVVIYTNNALLDFLRAIVIKTFSPITAVIFFYSFLTFLASLMILFFLKDTSNKIKSKKKNYNIKDIVRIKDPYCVFQLLFLVTGIKQLIIIFLL